jgi:hypothetical protein
MIIRLILLCFISLPVHAQRLERFSGEDESGVKRGFQQIRNYFGYIDTTSAPDTIIDGVRGSVIYFTVTDTISAPAFRFVQPVPPMSMPDKGDYASELYYEHEKEKALPYKSVITLQIQRDGWEKIMVSSDNRDANGYTTMQLKQHLPPAAYRLIVSPVKGENMSGGFQLQIGSFGSLKQLKFNEHIPY